MKTNIVYKSKDKNVMNDVVYKDAIILSPGTWSQQDKDSRISYPQEICSKYANNWKRSFVYVVHTQRKDGAPVDAKNIVGFVENKRYDYLKDAIVGDLRIMPITQTARDIINQIDRGIIKHLSPEVRTWDRYNHRTHKREVTKLEFNGVALVVDNPACKTASIDARKKIVNV